MKTEIKDDGTANASGPKAATIPAWDYRRAVLRQVEVASFIHATKGEKYSALLPLFGLHPMEIAAENLRQLAKNADSLSRIERSKIILNQVRARRRATFGTDTDEDILEKVATLHRQSCPDKDGRSIRSNGPQFTLRPQDLPWIFIQRVAGLERFALRLPRQRFDR